MVTWITTRLHVEIKLSSTLLASHTNQQILSMEGNYFFWILTKINAYSPTEKEPYVVYTISIL